MIKEIIAGKALIQFELIVTVRRQIRRFYVLFSPKEHSYFAVKESNIQRS